MWKLSLLAIVFTLIVKTHAQEAATLSCKSSGATSCLVNTFVSTSADQPISYNTSSAFSDPLTVTSIKFYDSTASGKINMPFIPKAIFTTFPNLKTFTVQDPSLTTLVTDNFGDCAQLDKISLVGTSIASLPSAMASKCAKLTNLYVEGNTKNRVLTTVDGNAFQGLTSLTTLNVIQGALTCIPPELFKPTPNIIVIFLLDNNISVIDPTTFVGLSALSALYLNSNSITALPAISFASNKVNTSSNIFSFSLFYNSITSIDPQLFDTIWPQQNVIISFKPPAGATTCIPSDSSAWTIDNTNYAQYNSSYNACYQSWTGNPPVPCAATTTTSTTTTSTTTTTTTTSTTTPTTTTTTTTTPAPTTTTTTSTSTTTTKPTTTTAKTCSTCTLLSATLNGCIWNILVPSRCPLGSYMYACLGGSCCCSSKLL